MENTRHERAIVVVASYVIGFTSAFIAYGIAATPSTPLPTAAEHTAPAVAMQPRQGESYSASVQIRPEGLVVVTNEGERMLSARRSSPFLANVISSKPEPGISEQIVEAELSRDSKFVYFCEQLTKSAQDCNAYVYSVDQDILHPLQVRGEQYSPQIVTHTSAWSAESNLMVDGFNSVSPETPWLLE